MRNASLFSALAGLAFAAALPQHLNFKQIDSAPTPSVVGPPIDAVEQPVTYDAGAAASSAAAAVATDPATHSKRSLGFNDDCGPQPDGFGPKVQPDTPEVFLASQELQNIALSALIPAGYERSFQNLQAAVNANSYLGLTTFQTYDTIACQQRCDAVDLCTAFNIYIERDPSVKPAAGCANPPSITNFKCTLWGSGVTAAAAVNNGQYREQFHVVITGSNGYTKQKAPDAQRGFDGPTKLGGAIDAPLGNGVNKYYAGPYNPQVCAAACKAQTEYSKNHANNGTYTPCNFFNSYVVSKANVPQGTYCSLYAKPYDKSYSTNYGEYRNGVYYSVSSSYSYTLTTQDPGNVKPEKSDKSDKSDN